MKRAFLFATALAFASPTWAQQADHSAHQQESEDRHAGHSMPAKEEDPHAGHDMPEPADDPHAGHDMSEPAEDPHAGHDMPDAAEDPHAGHDLGAPAAPPIAPPPPEAFAWPAHAADAIYGEEAMAASRKELADKHGAMPMGAIVIDRLEARIRNGRDGFMSEGEAWFGKDLERFVAKYEVESEFGHSPEVEFQGLWSHAIGPFFDLQAGVRYDASKGPNRAHLVLGVEGLAPYWFEVGGALFLSNKGELTARVEAEYDLRITQLLIIQPALELDFSAENIPELGIGAGLSKAEAGLRLRYEITPQIAPYLGVSWETKAGRSRDYARREGEKPSHLDFVVGLRLWF